MNRLFAMLCLVTVLCSGCSWLDDPDKAVESFTPAFEPDTEQVHVRITDLTDQGMAVIIRVTLANNNDVQLPLPNVHYRLKVPGVGSTDASTCPNTTIPPHQNMTIELPAAIGFANGQPNLANTTWHATGWVTYEPPGKFWQWVKDDMTFLLPNAAFDAKGTWAAKTPVNTPTTQQAQP